MARGNSMLTGLRVGDAMRRQVGILSGDRSISDAIAYLVKYKANALLVADGAQSPVGVVTKSDIIAAYFAGLPVDQPLSAIMMGPPVFCGETDQLSDILETMQEEKIHQVFVQGEDRAVSGLLAYPDIVGLMYRYCRHCKQNPFSRTGVELAENGKELFRVRETMTDRIIRFRSGDNLFTIMEELSRRRFWAVLITDEADGPAGVVSKTDLVLAYRHGWPPETEAKRIMTPRVHACEADDYLVQAIRRMIFSDVHRLFVHEGDPGCMVGVISFTDAARMRSGSCRACRSSQVRINGE